MRTIPGVAVVTGMARRTGIGHAICTTLLSKVGISVIGIDIQPLEGSSPLCHWNSEPTTTTNNDDDKTSYPMFCSRVASVLDHEQMYRAVSSGLREIRQDCISAVVNNAGIAEPYMQTPSVGDCTEEEKEVEDLAILTKRLEEYDSYIQTNLRSAFLVTEVCRKWFPSPPSTIDKRHEYPNVSIIHISSTRAHQSERHAPQEGYASAKSGLIGLMHAQGQSDLSKIARVNVISPGWINTDEEYVPTERDCEWHACGRVGRPQDVANLVAFLVDGDKSGFVSCEEFVLDGGVSRRMYYPE